MRRIFLTLLLILTACTQLAPLPAGTPVASDTPSATFSIRTHPDGPLYAGDLVSFEVLSPSNFQPASNSVIISFAGKPLGEKSFEPFGIGGRSQATFYWVWDTRGLEAGSYTLSFSVSPGGPQWEEKITLLPTADLPTPGPNARWESADSSCCVIHYISGTDAEKDLETLKSMVDVQAADVERRLGTKLNGKIPVTFLPRTLGHGGFTSDGIYVSYLHNNYAGSTTQQVTHHEMVHWLDNQLGGDMRPSILEEGLAVFLSDGHFKVEPILPRAAALIELGWYIPLRRLADSFYISQHEIGYAEAAALVSYMVTTYGWEKFNSFYRDIHPAPTGSQADALDKALQAHFAISLEQLEKNFDAFLRQQSIDDTTREDLRVTVAFYDTVRRYQRELDPSAYFLNTWLPDVPSMRQRNIVADFLRHPDSAINQRIEDLLVAADANLRQANYILAEANIRAANALLDILK